MWRKVCLVFIFIISTQSVFADAVALKSTAPDQYIVTANDTVWSIAERYLVKPWQWSQLATDAVPLYPGSVLQLKHRDSAPSLRVSGSPKTGTAIALIPVGDTALYQQYNYILDEQTFLSAPYVIGCDHTQLLALICQHAIVRGLHNTAANYTIVRRGVIYILPGHTSAEIVVSPIAQASVQTSAENLPTGDTLVAVSGGTVPAQAGDRLVAAFTPTLMSTTTAPLLPAPAAMQAVILALPASNIAVINYGQHDGAQPGQVVSIWQTGANSAVATAVVFHVFDNVSFAWIAQTQKPLQVSDRVRSANAVS